LDLIMTYSKTHQRFSNRLNKPEALINPQDFLGPNYETVLNFWKWIDSLSEEQWKVVADRYRNLDPVAGYAAGAAARDAAGVAARDAAWNAAESAAWNAAKSAAGAAAGDAAGAAAGYATYELIGMHKLLEEGKKLIFVPMFDSL
jgi:hypothetical protein